MARSVNGSNRLNLTDSLSLDTNKIIFEEIENEVIFINLRTGSYYSLVGTAVEVWRLLEQNCSISQISAALGTHYGVPPQQVASDVEQFLAPLLEEQIVYSLGGGVPAYQGIVSNGTDYAPPRMTVYDDMQDLLMIDPIHDVDESGWPNAKPS